MAGEAAAHQRAAHDGHHPRPRGRHGGVAVPDVRRKAAGAAGGLHEQPYPDLRCHRLLGLPQALRGVASGNPALSAGWPNGPSGADHPGLAVRACLVRRAEVPGGRGGVAGAEARGSSQVRGRVSTGGVWQARGAPEPWRDPRPWTVLRGPFIGRRRAHLPPQTWRAGGCGRCLGPERVALAGADAADFLRGVVGRVAECGGGPRCRGILRNAAGPARGSSCTAATSAVGSGASCR
mmetsp:Transcript_58698/g.157203  ORF Transcript_58698/g.157203 Transcript_58698/m.157203 type:complete len:236 (-) Transcript_58698:499-1206(-)